MNTRKICVVTGTRADYGLLYWLMKEIQADEDLVLQIVATGMHLSPEFGLTYKTIEEDGFKIDQKVEMLLSSDTPVGIAKSIGLATIGFADVLERLKPDILAILGDRFEIFAAAQAAMVARIPIAHLGGGESTEGVIDEAIRHSITKMSHLHFVANETYRQRVIQLGENPERVFNYGEIELDNIMRLILLDREALEHKIEFKFQPTVFLVTYHPVTLCNNSEQAMAVLLGALDQFPEASIIFTKPNADTNGRVLIKMIDEYVATHSSRARTFTSMGQLLYLSAIKNADVVIGNSSSGLTEVPALSKPTVNIGNRQKGRLKASSVIDCEENEEQIIAAIQKALSPDFKGSLRQVLSPYGEGNASLRIKEHLKTVDLEGITMKEFYDFVGKR
ncbi:MAG: UDP-N-acetylglucosamine 2-epimerase (hydrolyzing) [Firmicutes bacterium HGW-Firmicutes-15]|nr:MAG: UDP-N-acetylglucosamine 2-epimerase (hydrolyzing) [Firmicutes bacterium HGW-Firmicutes-15]